MLGLRLFFQKIRGRWRYSRGKFYPSPFHLRGELTEIIFEEQDGGFSSFCPEFGTASCGETELEASQMIAEAVYALHEGDEAPFAENAETEREEIYRTSGELGSVLIYDGPMRH